jgi:hypothetical protein
METPELAMLAGYGSQCRGRGHEDGGGSCRVWGDPGRVWGGRAQGVTGGGVTRRRRVWSFAVAARPVVLQSAARGGPLVAASTAWLSTTFCIGQRQGALHAHPTYCPSFYTQQPECVPSTPPPLACFRSLRGATRCVSSAPSPPGHERKQHASALAYKPPIDQGAAEGPKDSEPHRSSMTAAPPKHVPTSLSRARVGGKSMKSTLPPPSAIGWGSSRRHSQSPNFSKA